MPLCSAYQAVIFSSHISAVIWYCINTWSAGTESQENNYTNTKHRLTSVSSCSKWTTSWRIQHEHGTVCSLSWAKAHPVPGSQACESLDHSPRTVIEIEEDRRSLLLHIACIVCIDSEGTINQRKCISPWLEQHMMPKEQRLQENKISLRLISVFSPTQEHKNMY